MKALFNCNCIKNVYLRDDISPIELEITYVDIESRSWHSRRSISDLAHKEYVIEKYNKQYERIKEALLNKSSFVEIEL